MPSKLEVSEKLTKMGVEHDPNADMSVLFDLLRTAKAAAGAAPKAPEAAKAPESSEADAGDKAPAVVPPKAPSREPRIERPEVIPDGVMLGNVKHNGVFYKKGTKAEVDEETAEYFRENGFIN